jgi:UDP-N-acetylmuramoylalanine--D-glutamate ligase
MSLKESIPAKYVALLKKPVAVFGVGASGHAAANLIAKIGVPCISYDERAGEGDSIRHEFGPETASQHHLVIHGPAFHADHPWVVLAREAGCVVVSEIDFAQQFRRGPTIVVTGTNGKTTLQEFITFALKRSGVSAVATGQNQYPLSRLAVHPELDGVTAVCEVGPAYALQLQEFRFDSLFWTNFHEEHIDDLEERKSLFTGLLRLLHLSPDAAFYLGDSVFEAAHTFGLDLPSHARRLSKEDYPQWHLPDLSAFATRIHRPALALFRRYWLESGYSDSLLKGAAENFEVRAHRLHVTTVIGKTTFWNDSNATNFAATEAALGNFDKPVVWIGGGHFRGGDLKALAERVQPFVRAAVIIGDARPQLLAALREQKIACSGASDLRTAVEEAFDYAGGKAPVVFSPGFIAGEEYGDFMERGICYENAVLGLKHQKGSV